MRFQALNQGLDRAGTVRYALIATPVIVGSTWIVWGMDFVTVVLLAVAIPAHLAVREGLIRYRRLTEPG
ncbi:MAG: hypothetical protein MAG471_00771 [Acidimicrobiaceae bacterium]|nr:hypothetical protein [Acidimicrobiaceae bacterium]